MTCNYYHYFDNLVRKLMIEYVRVILPRNGGCRGLEHILGPWPWPNEAWLYDALEMGGTSLPWAHFWFGLVWEFVKWGRTEYIYLYIYIFRHSIYKYTYLRVHQHQCISIEECFRCPLEIRQAVSPCVAEVYSSGQFICLGFCAWFVNSWQPLVRSPMIWVSFIWNRSAFSFEGDIPKLGHGKYHGFM